jgi:tetratricopeptide (TPR) repeat protein
MLNLAHLNVVLENFETAMNLYQKALEKFPNNVEIQLYLAKAYFMNKQFDICLKLLKNVAFSNP